MKEGWKDILNYEGHYQVSDQGRIRLNSGRIMKIFTEKEGIDDAGVHRGYQRITLSRDGLPVSRTIHRLVATAFIKNPLNKKNVNHKNGIKADNRAINLEWSTQSENEKHAHLIGLKTGKGEKNSQAKLDIVSVLIIRECIKQFTQVRVAKYFNISRATVCLINQNKLWPL